MATINNYITIPEDNFSGGIDQLSSEGSVPPTYVEDALNATLGAQKYVGKRKGYAPYGSIPLRVIRVVQTSAPEALSFYFDGSLDLSQVRSTPLVVQGQTWVSSAGGGDFWSTASVRYYASFTADVRFLYPVGTTANTLTADAHGFSTANLMYGSAISSSSTTRDNTQGQSDSVVLTEATYAVTATDNNLTGSSYYRYSYVLDNDTLSGSTYVHLTASATSVSIPVATHALSGQDILVQCWEDLGTTRNLIYPDSVTNTSGDLVIAFSAAPSGSLVILLRSVPVSATKEGTVAANSVATVLCSGLDTPFLILQAYLESTPGVWTQVLPDTISVSDADAEAQVSFSNYSSSSARFRVIWATAEARTNKLTVTPQVTGQNFDSLSGATTDLQLTVWGLPHDEVYADRDSLRQGWVSSLDSYKSAGEGYLVSTLGGNAFREAFRTADGVAYKMPQRWLNLRQRATATTYIAPLFHGASDTVLRSRGGIQIPGGEEGWASITNVAYAGTSGLVNITVYTPGTTAGSLTGKVYAEDANTAADTLTLRYAVHGIFDGAWPVTALNDSVVGYCTFTVRIPGITSSDFNFTGQGEAGVFSDLLALQLSESTKLTRPVPGDGISSDSFTDGTTLSVLSVKASDTGSNVFVGPVRNTEVLPSGQLITYTRTGSVLCLRDNLSPTSTTTVEDIVRGDVLVLSDRTTTYEVEHLWLTGAQVQLDLDADGLTATCTLQGGATTASLTIGQSILLSWAGFLGGIWTVSSLDTSTQFTATPTADLTAYAGKTGVTAYIVPGQAQINYAGTFTDNTNSTVTASVDTRFVPVEVRTSTESPHIPSYTKRNTFHFPAVDYENQSLIKTALSYNSLYMTSGVDPIMKYDGTNILRAGIPRWQPGLLVMKSPGDTAKIAFAAVKTLGTTSTNEFTPTTAAEHTRFSVGDSVIAQGVGPEFTFLGTYTVAAITGSKIKLSGEPGTDAVYLLKGTEQIYRYYFQTTAVDRNGRLILGHTAQSTDYRVVLTEAAAVRFRMLGLPAFPYLDYDSLQLDIYRTKVGGLAPFFKLQTIQLKFADIPEYNNTLKLGTSGYVDFVDATPDSVLLDTNKNAILVDDTASYLEPAPISKYLTSIGNRLAYANITRTPRLTLDFLGKNNVTLNLTGSKLILRQDSTDTGTTTSLSSRRVVVEYSSTSETITATSTVFGTDYFTLTVAASSAYSVGCWVYLTHATDKASKDQRLCGWFEVLSLPNATHIRISYRGLSLAGTAAATAADVDRVVRTAVPSDLAVPVYVNGDFSLQTSSLQKGFSSTDVETSLSILTQRTAFALNAISATRQNSTSAPWFSAFAGGDVGRSQLVIEATDTTSIQFSTSTPPTGLVLFGNGTALSTVTTAVVAEALRLPSRIVFSQIGYPDLVGAAFATDPVSTIGCTATDVNPSDGQEITAIVPFFGESVSAESGGSQSESSLLVFKTDSVYLVKPPRGAAPAASQKLESQGVGCTSSGSVAVTRQGVIFAHTTGLYRLTRNNTIEPVGARLQRKFKDLVNITAAGLEVGQAHNFASERSYRFFFSQPGAASLRPTDGFSFDYTSEAQGTGPGAWTRLDNHNVTNFCNLFTESYFGTSDGRVQRLLQTEEADSYRDGGKAIGIASDGSGTGMEVTFRALDFGEQGVRKRILHILANYRLPRSADGTGVQVTGIKLAEAVNLSASFTDLDQATLTPATVQDGLSSIEALKQIIIRYAPAVSKATRFQLKLTDTQLAAPVQLVSLGFRVAGLSSKGTTEAKDSK